MQANLEGTPLGNAQARLSRLLESLDPLNLLALRRHFERAEASNFGEAARGTPLVAFCATVLERLLPSLPHANAEVNVKSSRCFQW